MVTFEHMTDSPQSDYYDMIALGRQPSEPSPISAARRLNLRSRALIDADRVIIESQRRWMVDLRSCSVLEIGCFTGNSLTLEIATGCRRFRGIDISAEAIAILSSKLADAGCFHAEVAVQDVAKNDLGGPWDIIYAHGVLHHFANLDVILAKLANALSHNGRLITFDPMQTSRPIRCARRLYRPFQKDAAWEFPFDRSSFDAIQRHFSITAAQGVMGYAKWAVPLLLLPGEQHFALELLQRWHEQDKKVATSVGPDLWRCMSSALCCEPLSNRA